MHWLDQAEPQEDGSIAARWSVPEDNPVLNTLVRAKRLPPSVILEVLAQAAACQAGLAACQGHAPVPAGRLVAIDHLWFLAPVQTGDTLELRVSVLRHWQTLLKCQLLATVGGKIAAQGVATFALLA